MTRILVAGPQRSGTTWVARVLSQADGVALSLEPDNADGDPRALAVRARHGWYPVLAATDVARDCEGIWKLAFNGGWQSNRLVFGAFRVIRRLPTALSSGMLPLLAMVVRGIRPQPKHAVVKSVFCALNVEWIAHRFQAQVLIIERDPLSTVSSWMTLGTPIGDLDTNPRVISEYVEPLDMPRPRPDASRLVRVSWCVGFLTRVFRALGEQHPEWTIVRHDRLIADPSAEFKRIFAKFGLRWTPAAETFLLASNRPGTGYETNRIRSDLPDQWRKRLTDGEVEIVRNVMAAFGL